MLRKRRTRQHVIADLAVHHVEGFVLRQGWTVERFWNDYGYDLAMFTYNEQGEFEPEFVLIQVKATERVALSTDRQRISFPVEVRDLLLWTEEILPVLLVVYDAEQDNAFWLHIQGQFSSMEDLEGRVYVTASIPTQNRISAQALTHFHALKVDAVERRIGGLR